MQSAGLFLLPTFLLAALRLGDEDAEAVALEREVGLDGVGVGVEDAQVGVVGGRDVDLAGGLAAGCGDGVGMSEDQVGGAVGQRVRLAAGDAADGGDDLVALQVDDGEGAGGGVGAGARAVGLVDHVGSGRVVFRTLEDRDHGGIDADRDGGENLPKPAASTGLVVLQLGLVGCAEGLQSGILITLRLPAVNAIALVENHELGIDRVEVSPDGIGGGTGRVAGRGVVQSGMVPGPEVVVPGGSESRALLGTLRTVTVPEPLLRMKARRSSEVMTP